MDRAVYQFLDHPCHIIKQTKAGLLLIGRDDNPNICRPFPMRDVELIER